jgi:ketosteroid isomerase-like protein
VQRDATDVVLANNRAFGAMDVDAMLALYAPDAEVIDRRRAPMGSFSGHDELRAYYLSIFHSACELREELTVLAARDGVVAAHCELFGRLAADPTGPEINIPYGLVYDIEDGRIVRLQIADDGDHALELSGLPSS